MKSLSLLGLVALVTMLASPLEGQSEYIYLKATPAIGGWNQWGPSPRPMYFSNVVMACDQPDNAISQAEQQFHPGLHHSYDGNVFLVSFEITRSDCFGTEEEAEQGRQAEYQKTKMDSGWSPVWFSFRFTRND